MKPAALVELLREFYRDKSAMRQRHVAAATVIRDYNFNNTYQYVINREDIQLQWLGDAIENRGGTIDVVPDAQVPPGRGKNAHLPIVKEDAAQAQAFVDKWTPRVDKVTDARHRSMLRVILGETMEAKRFFDQMAEGRGDLLGRRADGAGTPGSVMSTRWIGP